MEDEDEVDVDVAGADGAVTTSELQYVHLPLLTPLRPWHDLRAPAGFWHAALVVVFEVDVDVAGADGDTYTEEGLLSGAGKRFIFDNSHLMASGTEL